MGSVKAPNHTRIALTLATAALLVFCAWTAGLLLSIQDARLAMRQRVVALDAVDRVQDQLARGTEYDEAALANWNTAVGTLQRSGARLVPGRCGPELSRAIQVALVVVARPEPPISDEVRTELADALLALGDGLRAESGALSRDLENRVGALFMVAIGAIALAMTTLVASWWTLASREHLRRMGERLARQARVDYLTGVWNRRMVIGQLERELARSARLGLPVSVLMYDLDHFKSVNDALGHAAGDRALVEVSATVSRQLRGYDLLGRLGDEPEGLGSRDGLGDEMLGRYGGEEFLVVLPGHDLEHGQLVAERLRRAIESLETFSDEGRTITASFGVAASMAGARVEAHGLIEAADGALYRAKERGRNRVELCPEPLEGPMWS